MAKKGRRVRQVQAKVAEQQRGSKLGRLFGRRKVTVGKPGRKYVTPDFADGNTPTGCTSGSLAQQIAALEAQGFTVTVSHDGKSINWY